MNTTCYCSEPPLPPCPPPVVTMATTTILPYGAQVVCTNVDMNGYNGRDLHPDPEDVGFIGIVVGNQVEDYGGGDSFAVKRNVLGGTVYAFDPNDIHGFGPVICYTVRAPSGRLLDLMEHEIEVMSR